jgi:hypothetical protein
MAPRKREVDDDQLNEWSELRDRAAAGLDALFSEGPGPESPLDQLAWKAGTLPDAHFSFDNDLRQKIEHARDQRYTWREISAALGEGDDEINARRVKDKQAWRNKAFEEQSADR